MVHTTTQLHDAATAGNIKKIDELQKAGVDIDTTDRDTQFTPLHAAVKSGNVETAEYLLDKGANINAQDKKYETPLHVAVDQGQLLVVRLLIERRCQLELRNTKSFTPIITACEAGHLEIVKELIAGGANIRKCEAVQRTLLHIACNSEIVDMLITSGLDVNAVSEDGSTPLHDAVLHFKRQKMRKLLNAGADPTIKNKQGYTAYGLLCTLWSNNNEKQEKMKTLLRNAMETWESKCVETEDTEPSYEQDCEKRNESIHKSETREFDEKTQCRTQQTEMQPVHMTCTNECQKPKDENLTNVNGKKQVEKQEFDDRKASKKRNGNEKKKISDIPDRNLGRIAKRMTIQEQNCIKGHVSKEKLYRLKSDFKNETLLHFQVLKSIQQKNPSRFASNVLRPAVVRSPKSSRREVIDRQMKKELSLMEDHDLDVHEMMILSNKIFTQYYMFGIDVGLKWEKMEGIEYDHRGEKVAERSFQTILLWKQKRGKISLKTALESMASLELPYKETFEQIKLYRSSKT